MMFLAPTLGSPREEMLQDTLKSIVVAFTALLAALLFFWQRRRHAEALRWHGALWLPLALMAYALGSMAWSHTYLAGVEAIRWFLFSLLAWLALNTASRGRLPLLAWGIHAGAVGASAWAALQFWFDLSPFPQGPNPGSTFINRNFFAEFAVCTLPFSMLLLARARRSGGAVLLALTTGLVVTAILMTGTRAALLALWLQLLLVWPLIAWRCGGQFAIFAPGQPHRAWPLALLAVTVVLLGAIPTGNSKIVDEDRGLTALQRGLVRTQSIGPDDESLGLRMVMWRATLTVIRANPLNGVGAGAWEAEVPLYQEPGAQLETDYYVHNEFLQLVAEYGLVGWAFILALAAWLLRAAWRTWKDTGAEADAERPWRAALLCSLLALFVVSNIGFPWRLAVTGALFALCVGALAASDARLGYLGRSGAARMGWSRAASGAAVAATVACLVLAAYITQRAAESERKIVRATKLALMISASQNWRDPRWDPTKAELLALIREGVALNRHYRKITPMVADELAKWGDWPNATWIWESVLSSRPNIVAILSNAARGHISMGDNQTAMVYLEQARQIQPKAAAVRSLEVVALARSGQEARALVLAREALADGVVDYDLLNAAYTLGARAGDFAFAERAMTLRAEKWPAQKASAYLQLGTLHARGTRDMAKAEAAFRQALALATPEQREGFLAQMPPELRQRVAAPAQTSSSKP